MKLRKRNFRFSLIVVPDWLVKVIVGPACWIASSYVMASIWSSTVGWSHDLSLVLALIISASFFKDGVQKAMTDYRKIHRRSKRFMMKAVIVVVKDCLIDPLVSIFAALSIKVLGR